MAGVTDSAFRRICKTYGAGLVYSEMVSAKGIAYNNKNTADLMTIAEEEKPVAVQMFGSVPEIMADMARSLNERSDIAILDINMGCPAPKIVKNGEGSALMLKPELAGEIISAVAKASNKPVTVKFRKGFDDSRCNAVELAKIAENSGAAAVTIHGRTREQYYSGKADWDIIAEVKSAVSIPVVGNGDIFEPEDAKAMIDHTGCDAVMLGRGTRGNPFLIQRTVHYLETGELLPEPTTPAVLGVASRHIDMICELKGEEIGIREMRKHLGWYIKGMPYSAEFRQCINKIATKERMQQLIEDIFAYL
jgi:nifR3 family TIM-barrel protein